MKHQQILPLIACFVSAFLTGCGTGYQKHGGKWKYVTSDEYNGVVAHSIPGADGNITLLGEGFAKDKKHVYLNGVLVKDADPSTFRLLKGTFYAKDKTHVFAHVPDATAANCGVVFGADPHSFQPLKLSYARDKTRFYCGTVPMNVANPAAFEPLNNPQAWGSDMWSSFFDKGVFLFDYGDEFKDLVVSRDYPAMTGNGVWARDGQHYYFGPARIEGVDYASFRIIDSFNSRDMFRKYMFSFPAEQAAERRTRYIGIK